jgi:putative addiction module component (TIGR02574 family)
MSKRSTEVLEEALLLPPLERAELADRLLSSLDSPSGRSIDELWALEAEDRIDAFERGEIKAVSSREAFQAIKRAKPLNGG